MVAFGIQTLWGLTMQVLTIQLLHIGRLLAQQN
jgi:hypothetical protein